MSTFQGVGIEGFTLYYLNSYWSDVIGNACRESDTFRPIIQNIIKERFLAEHDPSVRVHIQCIEDDGEVKGVEVRVHLGKYRMRRPSECEGVVVSEDKGERGGGGRGGDVHLVSPFNAHCRYE